MKSDLHPIGEATVRLLCWWFGHRKDTSSAEDRCVYCDQSVPERSQSACNKFSYWRICLWRKITKPVARLHRSLVDWRCYIADVCVKDCCKGWYVMDGERYRCNTCKGTGQYHGPKSNKIDPPQV